MLYLFLLPARGLQFVTSSVSELTQQERKEDGKPCVTSVTIILFETTFHQTSLSFNQIPL